MESNNNYVQVYTIECDECNMMFSYADYDIFMAEDYNGETDAVECPYCGAGVPV